MILYLPFILQGAAMIFDEFHFHYQRTLPKWEKIGHPLDSLSVLLCYLWICTKPPNDFNFSIYVGLSIFSSILVTKDEFVHTKRCVAGENWLHAVLFILHPVTFAAAGILWIRGVAPIFLILPCAFVALFMVYQILYWNLIWKPKRL